jgi:hypothetical protein
MERDAGKYINLEILGSHSHDVIDLAQIPINKKSDSFFAFCESDLELL